MFDQSTFLEKVKQYISDKITLKELRDEYIRFYPVLFEGSYPRVEEVIDEIELSLIEIENNRMTKEDLKKKLEKILSGIFINKDHFVYETESIVGKSSIDDPRISYENGNGKGKKELKIIYN